MTRIRIIGGEWRSRLLDVAAIAGLRPTPDRVRETLFNWLGQDLSGLACLDLFAGTGALGFEAASRGAASVTLVERDPRAFSVLARNARRLGGERLRLVCADAVEFLAKASPGGEAAGTQGYDVVLLDPPYQQDWLARVAAPLERIANPGARLYAEAERPIDELGAWVVVRRGRAGQVHYHLLERA